MVRNALAVVRLLNREVREEPGAAVRRAEQRAHGDTIWGLRDGLVADDLRDVLPAESRSVEAGLEDYDLPIPMMEDETDAPTEVPDQLTVLRVG